MPNERRPIIDRIDSAANRLKAIAEKSDPEALDPLQKAVVDSIAHSALDGVEKLIDFLEDRFRLKGPT